MTFSQLLLSHPPDSWATDLALVFDWYDGPRAGLCRLRHPAVEFRFRLLDERASDDGADERLLQVDELPAGSVEEATRALADLGRPDGPIWVPVWRFPSEKARARAESLLRDIEGRGRPTSLVVLTRDLVEFLGRWNIQERPSNGTDWFSCLNIPSRTAG